MSSRLQHSLRFALPNLVAVLVATLLYELFQALVRGAVPEGATRGDAVAANMAVWALIAVVIAAVTFLLHLSDVVTRPPGWGFAWLEAAWLALMSVIVVRAIEAGALEKAAALGLGAILFWLWIHRFIPGWPGASRTDEAGEAGRKPGPDLP